MQIIKTISAFKQWRRSISGSVAFVPTMGNLHQGHLNLVHQAKQKAQYVVVSIFVNRLQFGQGEDFDQYPRTLEQDATKLAEVGVDVVFAPDETELYPNGVQTYHVEPPALQNELCGAFRPGHFRGVATVVTKLFNIVEANVACFGKKDYQQLTIIQNMVHDLNIPIEIEAVATTRADDGLALSSRNQYLNVEERFQAAQLYQMLKMVESKLQAGRRDFASIEQEAIDCLNAAGWQVDYVAIREAKQLLPAKPENHQLVILVAARLGKTRLIDNLEVSL